MCTDRGTKDRCLRFLDLGDLITIRGDRGRSTQPRPVGPSVVRGHLPLSGRSVRLVRCGSGNDGRVETLGSRISFLRFYLSRKILMNTLLD